MLRQRILTALVLLLILAGAVSAPSPWPLLALLALMTGCALWEWLRLVQQGARTDSRDATLGQHEPGQRQRAHAPGRGQRAALWGGIAMVVVLLGLLTPWLLAQQAGLTRLFGAVILPLAGLFWLLAAPAMVLRARIPAFCRPGLLAFIGVLILAATWYALAWIFLYHGAGALISLWALIWCADIAAYFTGRSLGRHKLAPRVSPGKTWEGAAGGVLAATLWLAACALWWPGSFGALLLQRLPWPLLILAGVVLAAWSIVGDLFESLLKRRAGAKDSSQLLPGHGGVYDRIDAVLPVAPLAILLLITG